MTAVAKHEHPPMAAAFDARLIVLFEKDDETGRGELQVRYRA
jgi:hypothetical protein